MEQAQARGEADVTKRFEITIKRAYAEQSVRIGVAFHAFGGPSVSGRADGELSTADARTLAAALIAEADRADAVAAKKEATKARRDKWREREIAAGRMKVISAEEFFGRSSKKGNRNVA